MEENKNCVRCEFCNVLQTFEYRGTPCYAISCVRHKQLSLQRSCEYYQTGRTFICCDERYTVCDECEHLRHCRKSGNVIEVTRCIDTKRHFAYNVDKEFKCEKHLLYCEVVSRSYMPPEGEAYNTGKVIELPEPCMFQVRG